MLLYMQCTHITLTSHTTAFQAKKNLLSFHFYPIYQIIDSSKYAENSKYADNPLMVFKEFIKQDEIKNVRKQNNARNEEQKNKY